MKKIPVSSWRSLFLLDCNPVVRWLTISDIFSMSSIGLISPIFALFIDGYIIGADAAVAGLAATIYLFTRSIGQIPAASFIDKVKGELDDFWFLFVGTFICALIPLVYIFIHTPLELYIVQFIYGTFSALIFPSWCAVFTRHVDKNREGMEWGVYQTLVDFSGAGAAVAGGVIAVQLGFSFVFVTVSILGVIGALSLFLIRPKLRVK